VSCHDRREQKYSRASHASRANDATTDFSDGKHASKIGIALFKIVQCENARTGSIMHHGRPRQYNDTDVPESFTGGR
jgi:hypothetical protein